MGVGDWWGNNMPTWLGGNTPPPPPPRAKSQLRAAQTQVRSGQTDAQRSLNPHPTGQTGTLPCQAIQPKKPCDLKMFEVVEHRNRPTIFWDQLQGAPSYTPLKAKRGPFPKTFAFDKPNVRVPKPPPYKSGAIIEMVSGYKKRGTVVDAIVRFEADVKCGEHPVLEIINPQGEKQVLKGVTQKRFEVEYPEKSLSNIHQKGTSWTNINNYWPWGIMPFDWKIRAVVCGVRPKEPPFSTTEITLRIWPGDHFDFKLEFRPRWKTGGKESGGSRTVHQYGRENGGMSTDYRSSSRSTESNRDFLGRDRDRTVTSSSTNRETAVRTSGLTGQQVRGQERVTTSSSTTETSRDGRLVTTTGTSESTRGGRLTEIKGTTSVTERGFGHDRTLKETTTLSDGKGDGVKFTDESTGIVFQMRRCGEVISAPFRGLDAVIAAIDTIDKAWESFQKWLEGGKPKVTVQVGWKIDFSFSLFSGELKAQWGWNEYEDHRAFFGYGLTANLKVFEAKVDINYGLGVTCECWLGTYEFSCVIGAKGSASFELEGEMRREGPDSYVTPKTEIKIVGAASITVYVKAIALSEKWCKAEATLKLPFEVEGKPKLDKGGFVLVVEGKIKKLKGTLTFCVRGLINFERERDILPEKVLLPKREIRLA